MQHRIETNSRPQRTLKNLKYHLFDEVMETAGQVVFDNDRYQTCKKAGIKVDYQGFKITEWYYDYYESLGSLKGLLASYEMSSFLPYAEYRKYLTMTINNLMIQDVKDIHDIFSNKLKHMDAPDRHLRYNAFANHQANDFARTAMQRLKKSCAKHNDKVYQFSKNGHVYTCINHKNGKGIHYRDMPKDIQKNLDTYLNLKNRFEEEE